MGEISNISLKCRIVMGVISNISQKSRIFMSAISHKVRKKTKIRNRYNQIPHLTRTSKGRRQIHKKTSYAREPIGLPFHSRWPKGCKGQTRQNDKRIRNKNNKKDPETKTIKRTHKRSTALERLVRQLLEGALKLSVPPIKYK